MTEILNTSLKISCCHTGGSFKRMTAENIGFPLAESLISMFGHGTWQLDAPRWTAGRVWSSRPLEKNHAMTLGE